MRRERRGFWIAFCAVFFYPTGWLVGRSRFEGLQHIPAEGGVLVVANHVSHLDPIFSGLVVHKAGRVPRFLAKHSLWKVPLLRQALRGQPGRSRSTATPPTPSRACGTAVEALSRRPVGDHLPGGHDHPRPRRLADALPHRGGPAGAVHRRPGGAGGALGHPGGARRLPAPVPAAAPQADHRALRRSRSTCPAYRGRPVDAALLREVTDLVMARVRALLAEVRDEPAPDRVLPPARSRVVSRARSAGSRCSGPVRGARRSPRCSPTPAARCGCGRAGPRWPPRSTTRHANPDYLPGVELPALLTATTDAAAALAGADAVVLAVPSQTLRANLTGWRDLLPPGSDAGQPGQGRRAGHAAPDERGRRRRRRRRPRPGGRA